MHSRLKAVIIGPEKENDKIDHLKEKLWKTEIPFGSLKYPRFEPEEGEVLTSAKKKELMIAIATSDYLITFDKTAEGWEVKEALRWNTKVIVATEPPYRHYYLDLEGICSRPWEKIKWMRREAIPEFLESH